MSMDIWAFINFLTPDTLQAKEFNNLCLNTGNKNINFSEFLKYAFLAEADLGIKDLDAFAQENVTPVENKWMHSEIILQLLTWKNQNLSLGEQTQDVLPIVLHLDDNSISISIDSQSDTKISEKKRLVELLASIIDGILKNVSKGKRIDKDSGLDTLEGNPLPKDPLEKEPDNKEEAKTITINLTGTPSVLHIEKQVERESVNTESPVELKDFKPILFFEGVEKNINEEELIKLEASEDSRIDFDLIQKKTLKEDTVETHALDEKEIELKGITNNIELHTSKPKVEWEKRQNDILPNLEEVKGTEKNRERSESKEEGLVYGKINAYDMDTNKITDIKVDEKVKIQTSEMAEKIEKVIDRFSQGKETSNMIIKFKLNENDMLFVSLKREGLHISVNIKSENADVINMFYAQKETIVKSLEEKNIFTEIFVYPDGSQNKKEQQSGKDERKYYRKRNNEKEFYEVLMTQKV